MRLDHYLVTHGYFETRSKAQDHIRRGLVSVNGSIETKTGHSVTTPSITIIKKDRFVSRGGEKFLHAILDFSLNLDGKILIDIGSSTGGFTDCALKHGVLKVYAYDVGRDQMDPSLKNDPRIVLYENTNILGVKLPVSDLITIDVSFTSVIPILDHVQGSKADVVVLIKPQFEAGRKRIAHGVVKDRKVHEEILNRVLGHATSLGYRVFGLRPSAILGKSGNQEYVCYLKKSTSPTDLRSMIGEALCSKH